MYAIYGNIYHQYTSTMDPMGMGMGQNLWTSVVFKSDIQPSYWVPGFHLGFLPGLCPVASSGDGQFLLQFSPPKKTGLLMENGDFIVGTWWFIDGKWWFFSIVFVYVYQRLSTKVRDLMGFYGYQWTYRVRPLWMDSDFFGAVGCCWILRFMVNILKLLGFTIHQT